MGLIEKMRGQNLRNEPPPLNGPHQPQLPFSPEVASFIDHTTRQREELAYFKHHAGQLENDVKLANERIRSLEHELAFVRDDRDRIYRHDGDIMNSLENIETLIIAAKAKARAEAYAPPGSGTQQQIEETEQDRQITAGLAENLAVEQSNG